MRDPSKRIYQRSAGDITLAKNRCFLDADQGRVELALARIADLRREFRDNAHILYAEGLLKRDFLGQAAAAFDSFTRAYQAATQPKQEETRWFSLCNIIALAPERETFTEWVAVAVRDYGTDLPECNEFQNVLDELNLGSRYEEILSRHAATASQRGAHGVSAAILEIVLRTSGLPRGIALEAHKSRAMSLRALDAAAEASRRGEVPAPAERLALQSALAELEQAIVLDEYDATLWNFRSAWCILLRRFPEAIQYADEAIKLRPDHYHRPWHNKAHALRELGRKEEAIVCAKELVRMTQASAESPADAVEARTMLASISTPQSSAADFVEKVAAEVLDAAENSAREWQERYKGMVTPETAAQRLLELEASVISNPIAGYVPHMAALLSDLTPEMAYLASLATFRRSAAVAEYLIAAAVYIAAFAPGVERLDAARYLILMTFHLRRFAPIREFYRRSVLANAAAGGSAWSVLPLATRHSLDRIHVRLATAMIDDRTVSDAEREAALKDVVRYFEPGFVAPLPPQAIVFVAIFWVVVLAIGGGWLAWYLGFFS